MKEPGEPLTFFHDLLWARPMAVKAAHGRLSETSMTILKKGKCPVAIPFYSNGNGVHLIIVPAIEFWTLGDHVYCSWGAETPLAGARICQTFNRCGAHAKGGGRVSGH